MEPGGPIATCLLMSRSNTPNQLSLPPEITGTLQFLDMLSRQRDDHVAMEWLIRHMFSSF